jgi:hypothetical protein
VVSGSGCPSPATAASSPRSGPVRTRSAAHPNADGPGASHTRAPPPRPAPGSGSSAGGAMPPSAHRCRQRRTSPSTCKPLAATLRTGPPPRPQETRPAPPTRRDTAALPTTLDHGPPRHPARRASIKPPTEFVKDVPRPKRQLSVEATHDTVCCSASPASICAVPE